MATAFEFCILFWKEIHNSVGKLVNVARGAVVPVKPNAAHSYVESAQHLDGLVEGFSFTLEACSICDVQVRVKVQKSEDVHEFLHAILRFCFVFPSCGFCCVMLGDR